MKMKTPQKTPSKTQTPKNGLSSSEKKRNRYKNHVNTPKSAALLKTAVEETQPPSNKKNKTDEEYTPGSLSNLIQVKKYGKVIVPWDSSFGQDKNNTNEEQQSTSEESDGDDDLPDLKINPLFDLSKKERSNNPLKNKETRVFIGNFPLNASKNDLQKLLRKCGPTKNIKFNTPKNGKSKNAIVQFETLGSCEEALKLNGQEFKDHHLRVNMATKSHNKFTASDETIFVGNLAFDSSDEDLWKAFEGCGEIESVRIVRDDNTGRGKGFGFVTFKAEDSAKGALKLNGKTILGRKLRVMSCNANAQSRSDTETVKRKIVNKKQPTEKNKLVTESPKRFMLSKDKSIYVVGNMAEISENEEIWKEFENCGEIVNKKTLRSKKNLVSPRGFFINFESEESVNKALKINGKTLAGHKMEVMIRPVFLPKTKKKFEAKDQSATKVGSAKKIQVQKSGNEQSTPKTAGQTLKRKSEGFSTGKKVMKKEISLGQ